MLLEKAKLEDLPRRAADSNRKDKERGQERQDRKEDHLDCQQIIGHFTHRSSSSSSRTSAERRSATSLSNPIFVVSSARHKRVNPAPRDRRRMIQPSPSTSKSFISVSSRLETTFLAADTRRVDMAVGAMA